jgi:hypothetical protein
LPLGRQIQILRTFYEEIDVSENLRSTYVSVFAADIDDDAVRILLNELASDGRKPDWGGLSTFELMAMRLDLLTQAVPRISRIVLFRLGSVQGIPLPRYRTILLGDDCDHNG